MVSTSLMLAPPGQAIISSAIQSRGLSILATSALRRASSPALIYSLQPRTRNLSSWFPPRHHFRHHRFALDRLEKWQRHMQYRLLTAHDLDRRIWMFGLSDGLHPSWDEWFQMQEAMIRKRRERAFHASAGRGKATPVDDGIDPMTNKPRQAAQEDGEEYEIPVKRYGGDTKQQIEPEEGSREWYNKLMRSEQIKSEAGTHQELKPKPVTPQSHQPSKEPLSELDFNISAESLDTLATKQRQAGSKPQLSTEEANRLAQQMNKPDDRPRCEAQRTVERKQPENAFPTPKYEYKPRAQPQNARNPTLESEGDLKISDASLDRLRHASKRANRSPHNGEANKMPAYDPAELEGTQKIVEDMGLAKWRSLLNRGALDAEAKESIDEHDLAPPVVSENLQNIARDWYARGQSSRGHALEKQIVMILDGLKNMQHFKLTDETTGPPPQNPHPEAIKNLRSRQEQEDAQIRRQEPVFSGQRIKGWEEALKAAPVRERLVESGNEAPTMQQMGNFRSSLMDQHSKNHAVHFKTNTVYERASSNGDSPKKSVWRESWDAEGLKNEIAEFERERRSRGSRQEHCANRAQEEEKGTEGQHSESDPKSEPPTFSDPPGSNARSPQRPVWQRFWTAQGAKNEAKGAEYEGDRRPRRSRQERRAYRAHRHPRARRRRLFLSVALVGGAVVGGQQLAKSAHDKKMVVKKNQALQGELALRRGDW